MKLVLTIDFDKINGTAEENLSRIFKNVSYQFSNFQGRLNVGDSKPIVDNNESKIGQWKIKK